MAYYPSIQKLLELENKTHLFEVRRSYISILSSLIWCAISLIIVLIINLKYYQALSEWNMPLLENFSPRWLATIPLGLFLEIVRKHHNDLYIFGLKRLTHHRGRLSLHYNVPSVKYIDIRAMMVRQDVLGRLFDYGDIEIGTAAQSNAELIVQGVRSPKRLAKTIDQLRTYNSQLKAELGDDEDQEDIKFDENYPDAQTSE